jgi:SAM-dependent methyltransferase
MSENLTEREYWDHYWQNLTLPVSHTLENSSGQSRCILEVIEKVTCIRPPRKVLEIGAAPGGFLAYFARRYGSEIHALEYSETGCRVIEENYRLLGYPVHVHRKDLFTVGDDFPRFDLVYSLGLIEHFAEIEGVIKVHRDLLKPNGILIIGVPHFIHVFWPLLNLLAPQVTRGHNRAALSLENWTAFEKSLGLKTVHKCYLGGFEPWQMIPMIKEEYASGGGRLKPLGRFLMFCLRLIHSVRCRLLKKFPILGKGSNGGKWFSSFAMAAYTATSVAQVISPAIDQYGLTGETKHK